MCTVKSPVDVLVVPFAPHEKVHDGTIVYRLSRYKVEMERIVVVCTIRRRFLLVKR